MAKVSTTGGRTAGAPDKRTEVKLEGDHLDRRAKDVMAIVAAPYVHELSGQSL